MRNNNTQKHPQPKHPQTETTKTLKTPPTGEKQKGV